MFSLVIRARDGRCQDCGTDQFLQNAHIIGRRYEGIRWDEDNAMALCRACHKKFTHWPLSWIDFVGEEKFFALKRRAQAPHPRTNYEAVIERLQDRLTQLTTD